MRLMLLALHTLKPAPVLARRGMRVRRCVRPNAFGNALGNSIADGSFSGATQPTTDALGDFIQKNQQSWDTRAAAYDQVVGAFSNTGATGSSNSVVYASNDVQDPMQPNVVSDAGGNPVGPLTDQYDLTDKTNFKDYLNAVNQRNSNGLTLDPQDVATSKALLFHYHGYSMGEQRGTAEQLSGNLDDQSSPAFVRALTAFTQASAGEQDNRYDFYSNIQVAYDANGVATRGRYVDVTRDGETVRVNWDRTFSNTARTLGVNADEAIRKTDFEVYQAAVNAAFDTDGVRSFNISGGWRPHPVDYAAIMGTPSPLPNPDSHHISSRALDINMINDVAINNRGYVSHTPRLPEPDIVQQFTNNLRDEDGVRQIFQPWRMLGNASNPEAPFVFNRNVKVGPNGQITNVHDGNATLHKDHLHFGF